MTALMEFVPTTLITFGSDYPYFPLSQLETPRKMWLPFDDQQAIESGNAARPIPRVEPLI
jgi:hypothetical protein